MKSKDKYKDILDMSDKEFEETFNSFHEFFVATICRRGLKFKAETLMVDALKRVELSLPPDLVIIKRFDSVFKVFPFLGFKRQSAKLLFIIAVKNVVPLLSLVKKQVAGIIRFYPGYSPQPKRVGSAIRWIVSAARKRPEKPFSLALASELLDAFNFRGKAFSKREELHGVVVAGRAYLRHKTGGGFSADPKKQIRYFVNRLVTGLTEQRNSRFYHAIKKVLNNFKRRLNSLKLPKQEKKGRLLPLSCFVKSVRRLPPLSVVRWCFFSKNKFRYRFYFRRRGAGEFLTRFRRSFSYIKSDLQRIRRLRALRFWSRMNIFLRFRFFATLCRRPRVFLYSPRGRDFLIKLMSFKRNKSRRFYFTTLFNLFGLVRRYERLRANRFRRSLLFPTAKKQGPRRFIIKSKISDDRHS